MAKELGINRSRDLRKITIIPEPFFDGAMIEDIGLLVFEADGLARWGEGLKEALAVSNALVDKSADGAGLAATLAFLGKIEESTGPDVAERQGLGIEGVVHSIRKTNVKGASA